jgi:hypothetical protein
MLLDCNIHLLRSAIQQIHASFCEKVVISRTSLSFCSFMTALGRSVVIIRRTSFMCSLKRP